MLVRFIKVRRELSFDAIRCSVDNYNCIKELQLKWFMPDFGKSLTWRNRLFLCCSRLSQPLFLSHTGLAAFVCKISDNLAS